MLDRKDATRRIRAGGSASALESARGPATSLIGRRRRKPLPVVHGRVGGWQLPESTLSAQKPPRSAC